VALTTISHEGETATVTLEVPVSLIPPGVTISVEDRPLEDAPRDVRDAGVRQAFHVLEPQALTFAQPVRVTVTMPRSAFTRPDGSLAITFLALRSAEGDWQWLADSKVTVTADAVTLSGLTTYLGSLFIWSDLTNLDGIRSDLSPQAIGAPFTAVVSLRPQIARPNPVSIVGTPSFVVDNPAVLGVGPAHGGTITPFPHADAELTCRSPGSFVVKLTMALDNFAADTEFFSDVLGLPPLAAALDYLIAGECVRVAPTATPPTASPTPSPTAPSPSSSPSPAPSGSASPSPTFSPGPSGSHPPKSSPSSSP
jgi:hypothetical protein